MEKKFILDIDNGNYLTSKKGKSLSSDYTQSYLFTEQEVKNIKSLYKEHCNEYDTELRITTVKYDSDFADNLNEKLMFDFDFPTIYGYWESKDDDYPNMLIQKYIEKCTKYDQLVSKIAKDIAKDYSRLIKKIDKQFPNKRSFEEIAKDIQRDWKKMPKVIKEYLYDLSKIKDLFDFYYWSKGKYEVEFFLNESHLWQGEIANRIKLELTAMLYTVYKPKRQPNLYYIIKESKDESHICDNQLNILSKYNPSDIAEYYLITEKESKAIKKEFGRKAVYRYDDEDLMKGKYNIIPMDDCILDDYLRESTWNDEYELYLPINPEFQQETSLMFDMWDLYYEDVVYRCLQKTRIVKDLADEIESTIYHDEGMWGEIKNGFEETDE